LKKRILFVDDEPNVLNGLKRMLYSMRSVWEMHFAGNGTEALDAMDKQPFDVVVTDMRMPRMSGDELLSQVRDRYPQTVRIVLSGHSDSKLIMGSVQEAHQYITKPASAEELKSKISKSCALLDLIEGPSLRGLITGMQTIPTIPNIFNQITMELKQEDPSMDKIGNLISKDPAITAKILQIVNSSFFSLPRTIESPYEAVMLLGLDTVSSLVLTIEVFSKFDKKKLDIFDIESLWDHCVQTGQLTREIAVYEEMGKIAIDNACMAGLLHDVGKLIFMENLTKEYKKAIDLSKKENLTLHEAEIRLFAATHCQVGAYLLGLWGISSDIVETVGFHHMPEQLPGQNNKILMAVYIANELTMNKNGDISAEELMEKLNKSYLGEMGARAHIESYIQIYRDLLERSLEDD